MLMERNTRQMQRLTLVNSQEKATILMPDLMPAHHPSQGYHHYVLNASFMIQFTFEIHLRMFSKALWISLWEHFVAGKSRMLFRSSLCTATWAKHIATYHNLVVDEASKLTELRKLKALWRVFDQPKSGLVRPYLTPTSRGWHRLSQWIL